MICLVWLAGVLPVAAEVATWSAHPATNDWNTATNWKRHSVPNGAADVAILGASTVTDLSINTTSVELSNLIFAQGAPSFTVNLETGNGNVNLQITGTGIMNKSGRLQSFIGGEQAGFFFTNASAGSLTSYRGLIFAFWGASTAAGASFTVESAGIFQAGITFDDNSTAADATIAVSNFAYIGFYDDARLANAVITLSTGAFLTVGSSDPDDHAIVSCLGGNGIYSSDVFFVGSATAGHDQFTVTGGDLAGNGGGRMEFQDATTAADATLEITGGTAPDAAGAMLTFSGSSTAGNALLTARGGVNGGAGGAIIFSGNSLGGNASVSLFDEGRFEISEARRSSEVTIGSLSGDGLVLLGLKTLVIGGNNSSTTFAGKIQDGGSLRKVGLGTLTLAGANTYEGGTTVETGSLVADNESGSATGSGAVVVNRATLGGGGMIAGATSINSGGFLAPAVGTDRQAILTIESELSFNSGATYTYTYRAKGNKARTDRVEANGVTINEGATVALSGQVQGELSAGLRLPVIDNTGAGPINGTFSNLPEGAIVNLNGNNLQASYAGGDGNDLILTVLPK